MVLDTALIRARRLQLQMSERDVASAIGRSEIVVRKLEAGENHEQQTLGALVRLAEALALEPAELFSNRSSAGDGHGNDEVMIEAALATLARGLSAETLSRALGSPLPQVLSALERLRDRRRATGVRVHQRAGRWRLVPNEQVLGTHRLRELEREHLGRERLTLSQARVLKQLVDGRIDSTWVNAAGIDDRNALFRLRRLGYAEEHTGRWRATNEVLDSLGLTSQAGSH